MRFGVAAAVVVALLLSAATAVGDPVRLGSPATCVTAAGSALELGTGTIALSAQDWAALDAEVRRLQNAETRLTAERDSYARAAETWSPGWVVLVTVFVAGVGVGVLY